MEQFQPEGMERVNSYTDSYPKIMIRGIFWKEIEADTSKISQDLREIQKTVQDYGHRLSNIPMKVDSLCHKMDEILKILPDLHKNLTDLKTEVADLKRNQREILKRPYPDKSVSGTPSDSTSSTSEREGERNSQPKTRDEQIQEILNSIK
ncbi:UNVERIFIED_CONTAM: hypothetical protein Sradi_7219600 [Sesamum radiatum]|uniref:Uncharacterized protein n=1 Tax=Sesamum radiatum TaxID=300843 RepID=A0AAW2INJ5_SESRA